jgi:hypothetical protein
MSIQNARLDPFLVIARKHASLPKPCLRRIIIIFVGRRAIQNSLTHKILYILIINWQHFMLAAQSL